MVRTIAFIAFSFATGIAAATPADEQLNAARNLVADDPNNDVAYVYYKAAFDGKLQELVNTTPIADQKAYILEHCDDYSNSNKTCDAIKGSEDPAVISKTYIIGKGVRLMNDEAILIQKMVAEKM